METVALVVITVGLFVMVATPIWALNKRQQGLTLRAKREAAGDARWPLSAGERALVQRYQRKTYRVPFWGWLCVLAFWLVGPVVMVESSEAAGGLIAVIALIAFVASIERSPVDASLAEALKTPEIEKREGNGPKGLARLPWFAKTDLILSFVLLPTAGVLLLTGHTTPGLIVAALWVIDRGLVFPVIISVLAKREAEEHPLRTL